MMKQFIQSIACMFVLVGALSGYGAVIAAWDFNESDTSGDGNTTTANGWTAFRIGNGATDTVNFTDTDGHTTSNSITLTQGSDAGWTDRDRISNSTGNDILAAEPALVIATYNELADGFDLNPDPTASFTLSGLETGVWYRLQFIGGMKTDISAARNVTLITDSGGGVAALFTADTTQYPSLYEVTGYSEYLDFQAENATAVLTFGEVSSGQKIVGGLIVATISAPIPEPPKPIDPPVFTHTSVGDGGTNVVMDWTSVTGQKFDVYRSTNLTEWALIASNYPAALGGSGTIFDDSLDHEQAFYRVAQTGEVFNKPNVILILFDDLRDHDAFTPYEVLTPNFDRLAERGLRFERAYCQFPVCNSSRASFLTGLRPPTTEVIQNTTVDYKLSSDVVTLPQAFRSNGYYTVSIGKVFHNNEGDGRSWDEDLELINGYTDPINYAKNDDLLGNADTNFYRINDKTYEYLYKGPEDLASYGYTDYHVATDVEAFLDEAASDHLKEPFFLAAGYKKPHNPYIGPSSYFDLYPPETLIIARQNILILRQNLFFHRKPE